MAIIYHYCAMIQKTVGVLSYGHGVVETSKEIETSEEYARAVSQISGSRGWDKTETVIMSISRLGGSPGPTSAQQQSEKP